MGTKHRRFLWGHNTGDFYGEQHRRFVWGITQEVSMGNNTGDFNGEMSNFHGVPQL